MNLKNFELHHEDEKMFHVKHPNGTMIQYPKEKLSQKAHDVIRRLQRFDDGGTVSSDAPYAAFGKNVSQNVGDASKTSNFKFGGNNSKSNMADGGTVEKDPYKAAAQNISKNVGNTKGAAQIAQAFDDGGTALDIPNSSSAQDSPERIAADAAAMKKSSGASDEWDGPIQQGSPEFNNPGVVAPANKAATAGLPKTVPGVVGALEEQKAANTAQAAAIAGQGKAEQQALLDTQKAIESMPSQQDILNQNKIKDDALFKAYQDKAIDPDHYWHNLDTPHKIAAGLGMFLGGFGAGLTGGPNMAQQMIQGAIDRDIASQRADKESRYNAWKMNREALGNDLAANLATQNQMYTGLKYKLMGAAAQFRGPQADAAKNAANSMIDQQIAQNNFKLSLMGGPTKENQDPSTRVPWLVPEPQQKAVFDEIKRAQDTRNSANEMMDNFEKAVKENTVMRTGAGLLRTPGSVLALSQGLAGTMRDLEGPAREAAIKHAENNMIPSPGDSEAKITYKRDALRSHLASKSSAPTAKGFGIDLDKYPSTRAPEPAPKIKISGGIKYMRGPNGEAIRVE